MKILTKKIISRQIHAIGGPFYWSRYFSGYNFFTNLQSWVTPFDDIRRSIKNEFNLYERTHYYYKEKK